MYASASIIDFSSHSNPHSIVIDIDDAKFITIKGFEKSQYRIYPDHPLGYTRIHVLDKLFRFFDQRRIAYAEYYHNVGLINPIFETKKKKKKIFDNVFIWWKSRKNKKNHFDKLI